jgi:type VI secretion system protein ImpL
MTDFARWVAPLEGGAATEANSGAGQAQTVFMLRPQPAAGTTGYVIEIDGQKLNYRNGLAQWANFIWPNTAGTPGAKITATTFEGASIEIINFPGRFGLEKMINSAKRTRQPDDSFRLSWENRGIEVGIDLRVLSSAQAQAEKSAGQGGFINMQLPERIVLSTANEDVAPSPLPDQSASPANDAAEASESRVGEAS